MPTNLSGRTSLILATLWLCFSLIFPSVPPSLFWLVRPMQAISARPNLKPGIDMVGGTSLLYEIKSQGPNADPNLAEHVMASLKKRVDPDGVRNLIWRPQGAMRLEIQMPMTAQTAQNKERRERFAKVEADLSATNIRVSEVQYAVENLKGDERRARLAELEQGSQTRADAFSRLASVWDQIQQARANQDAAKEAELQLDYARQVDRVRESNLVVSDLETLLDQDNVDALNKSLTELKQRFVNFPARQTAIDEFAKEYAEYKKVKGSIDDAAELKRLLRGSGVLEFHIVASDLPQPEYDAMRERLQRRGARPQVGDLYRWFQVDRDIQVMADVERTLQQLAHSTEDRERDVIIHRASEGREHVEALFKQLLVTNEPTAKREIQKQIEDSLLGIGRTEEYAGRKWALLYIDPQKSMARREGQAPWALKRARVENYTGENQVGFEFDPQGAKLFGELTTNFVGRAMAIALDDRIISAPNINGPIVGGSGVITAGQRGGFSMSEVNYMVNTLNAGALTAQLSDEPISERTVGPQLGEDNLRRGLYACYFGLVVVALFLIGYYYLAGLVATIAVLMNLVLILASMAGLSASFTLPGIAGIVLTIGMAVDANVLIFERLREEQQRGLSLRMALRNAYDRAWSAILDGNVTTAITAATLYVFGSEEIRGFGLTLLLGILSSMFTALFVTKTIFAFLVDRVGIQKLSSFPLTFPKWDRMLKPNIDWMSKAWIFYAFSTVFIGIGLVLFGIKWYQGQMLDIEFASGTSVQFELKEPTPIEDLRKQIDLASEANREALPAPSVVSVGTDDKTYEVVTPNGDANAVKAVILTTLQGKLNLTAPSTYEMLGQSAGEVIGKAIVPIEPTISTIGGLAPNNLRKHTGGVAIVLQNLQPPIPEAEIAKRINQQRLQSVGRFPNIEVDATPDGKAAIVMASDADLAYDSTDPIKVQQWTDELATPLWNLVRDAVSKPADLQKVTNFNPQIAGETQQQAMIALFLSIGAIMIYIWVRFGNLKYGSATVVALLHDTLFTLAAVGFAHYLAPTALGTATLLEPFRINLTLVAAILTVMGYSMNDTVVVFDRIRENRGKFGHVDRAVINDSINQTLSRTLLTGGTTILTIFVMYIWGGAGVHGFTFALLIGILVGTYSSIAIASPILLLGQTSTKSAAGPRSGGVRQGQFQGA